LEIEKTGKIIRKIAKKKNCKQIEWEPELHKAVRESALDSRLADLNRQGFMKFKADSPKKTKMEKKMVSCDGCLD